MTRSRVQVWTVLAVAMAAASYVAVERTSRAAPGVSTWTCPSPLAVICIWGVQLLEEHHGAVAAVPPRDLTTLAPVAAPVPAGYHYHRGSTPSLHSVSRAPPSFA